MFDFLDAPVTLSDIKELQLELQSFQNDNSRNVERSISILTKQLEDMQMKYNNPMPEVRTDFQTIKAGLIEQMREIRRDNNTCLSNLSDMTQLIKQVLGIVTQLNYKVGLIFF